MTRTSGTIRMRVRLGVAIGLTWVFVAYDWSLDKQTRRPRETARTTAELIQDLRSLTDASLRVQTAEMLGRRADAIPALIACLQDPQAPVRRSACLALSRLGDAASEAVPALLPLLAGQDIDIAIDTLGQIGADSEQVVPALAAAAADDNPAVRKRAIQALGQIGTRPALVALVSALPDPDPTIHATAIRTICRGMEADVQLAITALVAAAHNQDLDLRNLAGHGLAAASAPAIPAVLVLLQDPEPRARTVAARALALMEDDISPAFPALASALSGESSDVRFWSLRAFANAGLEQSDVSDLLATAIEDQDPDVRWQAVSLISQAWQGAHQTTDALQRALEDNDPAVRAKAAAGLQRLNRKVSHDQPQPRL